MLVQFSFTDIFCFLIIGLFIYKVNTFQFLTVLNYFLLSKVVATVAFGMGLDKRDVGAVRKTIVLIIVVCYIIHLRYKHTVITIVDMPFSSLDCNILYKHKGHIHFTIS